MLKSVWFGDVHAPFTNRQAVKKVIEYCRFFKPALVGQIGDLYDQYSFSNYAKIVNKFTPQQEVRAGRRIAEEMWEAIRAASPKARLIQKTGNHCSRIVKRVTEVLPSVLLTFKMKKQGKDEIQHLVNINKLFEFDGVETDMDYTNETRFPGYMACHGFRNRGEHVKYYGQNVVVGHSHLGGVDYLRRGNKSLWELNCGFLGDSNSLVFRYGDNRLKNWTPGYGVIDDLGPRFVAL